jgi:hypothetical protein
MIMSDYEEIILLDEMNEALLGCVYGAEGNPIPCYSADIVWQKLEADGFTSDEADDFIEQLTEGMSIVWIHPLELRPDFEGDDKRPHLRLVH